MNIQWTHSKLKKEKFCARWGHSSCVLPNQDLLFFGGYADKLYFNDLWIFNNKCQQWKQINIQQKNNMPESRSNASLFYEKNCQSIFMFGGGSSGNTRYNDLWKLQINKACQNCTASQYKGIWTKVNTQNQQIPWGRTYHIGQVYQNYFIIHGGQGFGTQLDDIWALNLLNFQWKELKCDVFPKGRKFHTSGIVNDKLYIIGGSYGDYVCLNEIYSFDLKLIKCMEFSEIGEKKFNWMIQQPSYRQSFTLARWGHISKTYENKIFIFGGRTFMELNDLLVFDVEKNEIRKIQTCKNPTGRRKPCSFLVGSFLIINSGYNGNYLQEQSSINLHFATQINSLNHLRISQISHKKQNCDIHINTIDNKYVDLSTKFIEHSFNSPDDMINFLQQLAEMNYLTAMKYINLLNNGVFIGKNQTQLTQNLNSVQSIEPQEYVLNGQIDENILKKYKINYSNNHLLANKKKILFNIIKESLTTNLNPFKCMNVGQTQFDRIVKKLSKSHAIDLQIHSCDNQKLYCQKYVLTVRSTYFKNLLKKSGKFKCQKVNPNPKILKFNFQGIYIKILIVYCYYGHIILPNQFHLKQLIQLYEISSKYAFLQVQSICLQQIKDILLQKNSLNNLKEQELLQLLRIGFENQRNFKWQFIIEVILSKIILGEKININQNALKLNQKDLNATHIKTSRFQILKSLKNIKNDHDKQNINNKNIQNQRKNLQITSKQNNQNIQKDQVHFFERINKIFQHIPKYKQIIQKIKDLYKFQIFKMKSKRKSSSSLNV